MIPLGVPMIVSHDAGGAEIISSFIKLNKLEYNCHLGGPAKKIFAKKLSDKKNTNLIDGIKQSDWVMIGTSWQSNLEYKALRIAKKEKKLIICFLDHWVNYRKRFTWHGKKIMPDEIWVGDIEAKSLAKKNFPRRKIKLIPNPYWKELKKIKKKSNVKSLEKIKLLYASANYDDFRKFKKVKYSDYDLLRYSLMKLSSILPSHEKKISILLHPSEKKNKFKKVKEVHKYKIKKIYMNTSILDLNKKFTHIVASNSMSLVVAKIIGKKTINIVTRKKNKGHIPDKFIDFGINLS